MADNRNIHHKKGMRYPPLNDLISKAHNKYELVLATSKRAREIVDGKEPLIPVEVNNAISIATDEIANDVVVLTNPKLDANKWRMRPYSLVPVNKEDSQIVEVDTEGNPLVQVD